MRILLFRTVGILHPTEARAEGGLDIETIPAVSGYIHLHGNGLDRSYPITNGACHLPPEGVYSCSIRITDESGREWRVEGWNVAGRVITPKGFKERRVCAEILEEMTAKGEQIAEIEAKIEAITQCLGMPIDTLFNIN